VPAIMTTKSFLECGSSGHVRRNASFTTDSDKKQHNLMGMWYTTAVFSVYFENDVLAMFPFRIIY
jgi:hypothetical protein